MLFRFAIVTSLFLIGHAGGALANEMLGTVSGPQLGPGLSIQEAVSVETLWLNDEPKVIAHVEGEWSRADWSILLAQDKTPSPVRFEPSIQPIQPVKKFVLQIPVTGEETSFKLVLINPAGKVSNLQFKIRFSDFASVSSRLSQTPLSAILTPSLGTTFIRYLETGAKVSEFSQLGLTGRLALGVNLFKNWNIGLSGFYTLFPYWTSAPGYSARFLGLNGRVGYRFLWPNSPWLLNLMAGVYYTNMYVDQDAFGYQNLAGLQLYPVFGRRFLNGHVLSIYGKFSPISNGLSLSFFDLNSRELAVGLIWSLPLANRHPFSFSLDVADLLLEAQEKVMRTDSVSLNLSYGF